jgi:hypothetical protein
MNSVFTIALILAACLGLAQATPLAKVELGTAENYVILTTAAITAIPYTVITGDIAVSPIALAAITGMVMTPQAGNTYSTTPQVIGQVFAANHAGATPPMLTIAILDKAAAFADAIARVNWDFVNLGAGLIGGLTLEPGLYKWTTVLSITTDLTLDAKGDPNAVWIFQIAGYFSLAVNTNVILIGGAQATNVFWHTTGYVLVMVGAHMEGIVMCSTAITFQTGASIYGRLYAVSVALDMAIITEPNPTTSLPSIAPSPFSPGNFLCMFTVDNEITAVYLGDVDVTSSVSGDLTNWQTAKRLSLPAPTESVVLAIIGKEKSGKSSNSKSGLQLECTGPTADWIFYSEPGTWTAKHSSSGNGNDFPANWYTEAYDDSSWSPVVTSTSGFYLVGGTQPAKKIWIDGSKLFIKLRVLC